MTAGSTPWSTATLFHSLPVEDRDAYLRSVHRRPRRAPCYYVLVFAKGAFPPGLETKPNEVDEANCALRWAKLGNRRDPAGFHPRHPMGIPPKRARRRVPAAHQ